MPAKKRTTARATATVSPPENSARTSDDAVGHIDAATALLCAALQRLANGSHPLYPSPPPLYPMIAHAAFHDVFGDLHDKTPPESCDVKLLPEAVKWLKSNVHRMKHRATLFVRKLVSVESNPPLDDVVASGATPLLAELLLDHAHPRTQLEAAWALTNVASGTAEQTQHVVDLGVLPHFVLLLSSPDEAVREQAVWALGNIAGDGARFRDVVLHLHPLPLLSAIIHDHTSIITVKRNAAWTISNLCRSKPPPAFDDVLPAVAIVDDVCGDESCDHDVLVDALWALSYLSDASDQMRDHILQHHAAAVQRCVALLSLPCSAALATPSMRALGNFAAGTADQTTAVLDMGAVTCFSSWLAPHQKRALRKEACWTLSNITADSPRGVTEVINAGLMPQIVALAQSPEFEVKKEALWCVSNAVTTGGTLGADHVMSCNAHVALIASLRLYDVKLVLLALETVDAILTSSSQPDANKAAMEECGLLDAVEELQSNSSIDVYNAAVQFLSKHFDAEEDGESADHNPTMDQ